MRCMNAEEFRTEMERAGRRMYMAALRVVASEADAEDAVQEAMYRLWKRRESFARAENRSAYAAATARRCALDLIESRCPEFGLTEAQAVVATESVDDGRERLDLVLRIIEGLPSPQREVISMRDVEGLEMSEIQEKLNLTAGNVRVILSRARAAVRKCFEGYDR